MSIKRDKRIDGEYDRPLSPVNPNPSKEDKEKLQQLIEKYIKMTEARKNNTSKAS